MSFYVHGIFLQAKTCQFTNKCKSDKTVALNSEKQNNCTEIVMLYVTEMKFQLSLIFTKVVMTNITAILVINILIRLPVMYNVFTSWYSIFVLCMLHPTTLVNRNFITLCGITGILVLINYFNAQTLTVSASGISSDTEPLSAGVDDPVQDIWLETESGCIPHSTTLLHHATSKCIACSSCHLCVVCGGYMTCWFAEVWKALESWFTQYTVQWVSERLNSRASNKSLCILTGTASQTSALLSPQKVILKSKLKSARASLQRVRHSKQLLPILVHQKISCLFLKTICLNHVWNYFLIKLSCIKLKTHGQRYSNYMKMLAMALYHYSARGYKLLSKVINLWYYHCKSSLCMWVQEVSLQSAECHWPYAKHFKLKFFVTD